MGVKDFIIEIVRATGALGVGVLMFLENVVPPIPSELIMPLGGYLSETGGLSFWLVVALGSLGSLVGAVLWYAVGRRWGKERVKRWVERRGAWVAITPDDLDRASDWFQRHGAMSVFVCRMIPFLRTVISIPAGITGMSPVAFVLCTAAGTTIWTLALACAGRLLGSSYPRVGGVLGWVTWAVLAGATIWYVYGIIRVKRGEKKGA
jgi:membrane protein DedA with SNARE-associated domain